MKKLFNGQYYREAVGKEGFWCGINYAAVTQFAVLVGVATVAPMFFSQAITGSNTNRLAGCVVA